MSKDDKKYRKINKKKLSVSSHYSKLIKDSFDHKFPQYPLNDLTEAYYSERYGWTLRKK